MTTNGNDSAFPAFGVQGGRRETKPLLMIQNTFRGTGR